MRAVQVETLTGPTDRTVNDIPQPTPGPDDVLVEVHSVGVSFPDLLLSRGEYQMMKPEPHRIHDLPMASGGRGAGAGLPRSRP